MADRWYYRQLDTDFGPVPFETLAQMAADGLISPEDAVRSEAGEWAPAASVAGLFGAATPAVLSSGAAGGFDDILQSAPDEGAAGSDVPTAAGQSATIDASLPEATLYFCRTAKGPFGPLTLAEVQAQISAGHVRRHDRIRKQEQLEWMACGEIAELEFPPDRSEIVPSPLSAPPSPPEPPPPQAPERAASLIDELGDDKLSVDLPETMEGEGSERIAADAPAPPSKPAERTKPSRKEQSASRSSSVQSRPVEPAAAARDREMAPASAATDRDWSEFEREKKTGRRLQWPSSPAVYLLMGLALLFLVVKLWPAARSPLRGTVTVDGHPVPVGSVSFMPTKKTGGKLSVPIVEGSFAGNRDDELEPGPYRVVVTVGNALGIEVAALTAVPELAELNGVRFATKIEGGEPPYELTFQSSDAE